MGMIILVGVGVGVGVGIGASVEKAIGVGAGRDDMGGNDVGIAEWAGVDPGQPKVLQMTTIPVKIPKKTIEP